MMVLRRLSVRAEVLAGSGRQNEPGSSHDGAAEDFAEHQRDDALGDERSRAGGWLSSRRRDRGRGASERVEKWPVMGRRTQVSAEAMAEGSIENEACQSERRSGQ